MDKSAQRWACYSIFMTVCFVITLGILLFNTDNNPSLKANRIFSYLNDLRYKDFDENTAEENWEIQRDLESLEKDFYYFCKKNEIKIRVNDRQKELFDIPK